jgi:hypothetical protein
MIETHETLLEYWKDQALQLGAVENEDWLRHSCDGFFLSRGYRPTNLPHSDAFQTYWDKRKQSSIKVTAVDTFNDSLLGNENWILVKAHGNDYIAPYNAARDMGIIIGARGLYYTDHDNSSNEELLQSLQVLIENKLAYEL